MVMFATVALLSIGIGLWIGSQQATNRSAEGYAHMGGDFTLESANGPVSLRDFEGKVVAIYFGYTFCPDICPTSLAALAQAVDSLPPEQRAQVQGLFISVDPERDTPARADAYAHNFHPQFIGLSGSAAKIADVAKRYFVLYEKVDMEDSAMGYAVDHSSIVYIINKHGVVQSLARHSDSATDLVGYLQEALAI
jgi:protein SCO1/2